jgi:cation diffusion facilitator CzcD-associated flavoprotein CzcO
MTAFSDHGFPPGPELHPAWSEVHAYLRGYAERFGVTERIRFGTRVRSVVPGWWVDGEPFDAVVIASGRFRRPALPSGLEGFRGDLLHSFDYPGSEPFAGRRVLVLGNGISGLEIATDLSGTAEVLSACRKPRYVIEKNVGGVSSDWQWYTMAGALERRMLPKDEWGRRMRNRVVRIAGHPADFGAPAPDPDFLVAGISLCQDYLRRVAAGRIACRGAIASVAGREVTFADGRVEAVDAIVCATGFALDLPYLDPAVAAAIGPGPELWLQTHHPDLPRLGFVGQYLQQGPYLPVLELQARWIAAVWAGDATLPPPELIRAKMATAPRPPLESHNALALELSEASGVAPQVRRRLDIAEPLLFGPMLPSRYRLDGPGARAEAEGWFAEQLASAPRPPVRREDLAELRELGYGDVAEILGRSGAALRV